MIKARPAVSEAPIYAPSLEEIEGLAGEAFLSLPERFRRPVADIVFRVEEFPDEETEEELVLESPFDLLGLYRGVSLAEAGHDDPPRTPALIFLYRRPILDYWCETGEDLLHVVRHVLIHEIGHHLGLSDEDMERIEDEAG
jgi:predicted Zn-dependent protease with MMP-like domain